MRRAMAQEKGVEEMRRRAKELGLAATEAEAVRLVAHQGGDSLGVGHLTRVHSWTTPRMQKLTHDLGIRAAKIVRSM